MQYITPTDPTTGHNALYDRLHSELSAGKSVLWLTSGGSNIQATVVIMNRLTANETKVLTIGLIDERYGPVGHQDSNWQQLLDAGFYSKAATTLLTLTGEGSLAETAATYNEALSAALASSDIAIALLGIGADGHTAGILPGTAAAATNTAELVCGYHTDEYDRITATPSALQKLDVAYVFAFGASKKQPLEMLQAQSVDPVVQPAQILKTIPEVYVYSDQIGGSI